MARPINNFIVNLSNMMEHPTINIIIGQSKAINNLMAGFVKNLGISQSVLFLDRRAFHEKHIIDPYGSSFNRSNDFKNIIGIEFFLNENDNRL